MSTYIYNPKDVINSNAFVTWSKLLNLLAGKVNVSQLTKTGAANGVAQIDSNNVLNLVSGNISNQLTVGVGGVTMTGNVVQTGTTSISSGTNGIVSNGNIACGGTLAMNSTNYPQVVANSHNRLTFGESIPPGAETGTVVCCGSGSSSRNILFTFAKTGVRTGFIGMDGINMTVGCESTGGLIFATNLVYASSNILASGTTQLTIANSGAITTAANGSVSVGTGGISTTGKLTALNGITTATGSNGTVLCGATGIINSLLGSNIGTGYLVCSLTVPSVLGSYPITIAGCIDMLAFTSGSQYFAVTYTNSGGSTVTNAGLAGLIPGSSLNAGSIGAVGQFCLFNTTFYVKASTTVTLKVLGSGTNTSNVTGSIYYA